MSINSFIGQWRGGACRHIPDSSPYGVLDTRFAGLARDNRWNRLGEPTLYLASDHAVLIGEFARHLQTHVGLSTPDAFAPRRIFELHLSLGRVLDLRVQAVCDLLSLDQAPNCFQDRELARATAGFLRNVTSLEAVIVPSMVFLDDPSHWVLVVFLENVKGRLGRTVDSVDHNGLLHLDLSATAPPTKPLGK